MKLNLLAVSTLLALAAAQDASSTSTGASSATTSLSPEASCAVKCADTDRCCIAACYKVPCPSDSMANATNTCVAACPQGSGTPADTDAYSQCQARCFSSHFFPASATNAGSQATGGSSGSSDATATKSGSSSSETGSSSESGSGSSSGTASSTGASASSTENAAAIAQLKVGVSAAGVLGVALGIWAL
ncbi:hypothetical protein ATEIFO6365_0002005300 [Aspergillus terreus]|uniref:Uncharacterized protein n=1 Tax=Aspergillus terreus TaxID=33178 RepID=A0A5M3YXD7_ASPTE|nr:hypothetical protein ATETN484_0004005300 [Aspergillus terreus]GFF12943.1 hypothetical protein ATEIFO6365_0002005300 [Aspergillus terreus]